MIKFGLEEVVIKSHGIHMIENLDTLPKVAVGVFSRHLFNDIISKFSCKKVGYSRNANFEKDVYILRYNDTEITFFMAGKVKLPY